MKTNQEKFREKVSDNKQAYKMLGYKTVNSYLNAIRNQPKMGDDKQRLIRSLLSVDNLDKHLNKMEELELKEG